MLLLGVRVWGRDRTPRRGGVIYAANHQSYLDPPLVGGWMVRQPAYLARGSLFENRLLAAVMRWFGAMPVQRGAADAGAFKRAVRLLRDGGALLVFPEAARTFSGRIEEVKPGIFSLARKAQVPIVPVAIEGTFDAWPRTSAWPRRARIWIEFGPPIYEFGLSDRQESENVALLTRMLRDLHNGLRLRAGRPAFDYPPGATNEACTGGTEHD